MTTPTEERRFRLGWQAVSLVIGILLVLVLAIYMGSTAFAPAEQDSAELLPPTQTPAAAPTMTPGAASLVLSPPQAAAGEIITATGAGFPGNSPITLFIGPPGEGSPAYEYTQTVSELDGTFVYPFIVPDAWPDNTPITPGMVVIVASDPFGNVTAQADLEYLPAPVEGVVTGAETGAETTEEAAVTGSVDSGELLTYTNEILAVIFQYPAEWQNIPGEPDRYAGDTGFFAVEPLGGIDTTLDVVCTTLAAGDELPFGTTPTLEYTTVGTQPACLIMPAADQAPEMNGQAAMVITYPAPVTVTDPEMATYAYVVIYADQAHLMSPIIETLTFLPVE